MITKESVPAADIIYFALHGLKSSILFLDWWESLTIDQRNEIIATAEIKLKYYITLKTASALASQEKTYCL